jgi:hypothetical protein
MYVKPAKRPAHLKAPDAPDHLIVRDPISGQVMPAEGRHVPDGDLYWHKRLQEGDIEEAMAPAAAPEPAEEPAAAPPVKA